MEKQRNAPAQTANANVPAKQQTRTVSIPVPDGWYDLTIYDIDPEYQAQTSTKKFVVMKLKLGNSLRYKGRTFNYYIGEDMEGSRDDGATFASARANCIERFGVDPFQHPDQYLDLVVRGHLKVETVEINNQNVQVNRVVSIYPKLARDNSRPQDADLEQEIPF